MIYPPYLEKEVKRFCKVMNISVTNDNILKSRLREVEDFLNYMLRRDRLSTKRKENTDRLGMRKFIESVEARKAESPIEEFLFIALHKEGLDKHFVPQFKIGTKRVDFACKEAHLVIECDGKEYHHTDQLQIEKDQIRDKYLARKGWRVLHIEGLAIRRNIKLCMDKIKEAINPFLVNY